MNSSMTFLMYREAGSSGEYTKLIDIKDYPDSLMGEREQLDNTDLSSDSYTYEPGIRNPGGGSGYEFTANYDHDSFKSLLDMEETEYDFALWFGGEESNSDKGTFTPTGEDGKFSFSGYLSVDIVGKGVNEVREMTVTIMPTSTITFE